jgi:hypothetical protein
VDPSEPIDASSVADSSVADSSVVEASLFVEPSSPAQATAEGHTQVPFVHVQLDAMVVLVPSQAGLGVDRS